MPRLRDRLVGFIASLRPAGVRISVAESIDAMNAVAAAGIERARMHEALASALIKDETDRPTFDQSFSRFFPAPARERGEHPDNRGAQVSAGSGRGRPGESPPTKLDDQPPRKSDQPRDGSAHKPDDSSSPRQDLSEKKSPSAHRDKSDSDLKGDHHHERGDSSALRRAESAAPGLDAARNARLRTIERMPFEMFSDLDYDEA